MTTKSALIAMSGGVDSTVAAMLMKERGYQCHGAMMKLHPNVKDSSSAAKTAAAKLNIPFEIFDFSDEFHKHVVEKFVRVYEKGETPNPCVYCNKNLKFGLLLNKALDKNMDYIVTGHYAQIEKDEATGRFFLKKAKNTQKDQSYALFSLTQKQLSHIKFPLGSFASKADVRDYAEQNGLENAQRSDSQDICFIPDGDYVKFIKEYTSSTPKKGRFIDTDGNFLGENKGIINYTIGQRRGIGLSMPYPAYVLEINAENNTVIIGKNESLFSKTLKINNINLITSDKLDTEIRANVKIRYSHKPQPATIRQTQNDEIEIEFDEPQRAITKGQAAVIYDGDYVIGGGTIF
jgi:tRNA-specific 2-thiouridylase